MRAVVLFSGGIDSTTALMQAIWDMSGSTIFPDDKVDGVEVLALTLDYGSLHSASEGIAAYNVVKWITNVYGDVVDLRHVTYKVPSVIFTGGKSSLMGEGRVPQGEYVADGPQSTVVPFRNAVLLSIAIAAAEKEEYQFVYAGMHATDWNMWAYADCSPEFLGAMSAAAYIGTMHKVRLRAPFMRVPKHMVVERASALKAPLHLTWSCYMGGTMHCGLCATCQERVKAFRDAGFEDPTSYLNPVQGLANGPLWPTLGAS